MAVWRKLRSLGALYLLQSVCVLPARPDVEREICRLADRVRAGGGVARVLRITRFRVWLAKIDRRDYFGAPRRAEAHAAVDRCARALEAFESEAFARAVEDTA